MEQDFAAVDVFPITTSVFGFSAEWFRTLSPQLIEPAYFLMALLLIIAIGVMVLKQFENVNLTKKGWGIPVIVTAAALWPFLVLGLKSLIDAFNTFLVFKIFGFQWEGFGFPELDTFSISNIWGWTTESLARLLPNVTYWIVYFFYITFFFFYAVLGPLIIAKGILTDEIESFLELVTELTVLFLWQTTLVIMVAFVAPEIVSGQSFSDGVELDLYFRAFILGIMIMFVPTITRKFGNHLGTSFFPPIARATAAYVGINAMIKGGSMGFHAVGMRDVTLNTWRHGIEFTHMFQLEREKLHLLSEQAHLEHELDDYRKKEIGHEHETTEHPQLQGSGNRTQADQSGLFIQYSKKAKGEYG